MPRFRVDQKCRYCFKKYSGYGRFYCSQSCSKFDVSDEARKKNSDTKLSEKNPMWKGDEVGIFAVHCWVKRRIPKPKRCSSCNRKGFLDLANKNNKYTRDLSTWEWLCRRCHMLSDGRMGNLKQ